MIFQDFSVQMDRLKETFGDKFYPGERMDAIFKLVEILDSKDFDNVVTGLIGRSRQAPLLTEIEESIKGFRKIHSERLRREFQEWKATLPMCQKCGNSGGFRARDKIGNPFKYSCWFNCTCTVGQRYGIPECSTWGLKWEPHYDPDFYNDEKGFAAKQPISEIANFITKSMPDGA